MTDDDNEKDENDNIVVWILHKILIIVKIIQTASNECGVF